MKAPVYFQCDMTIFVKIESEQEFDALDVGNYIGRVLALMVQDTNKQHQRLSSGKMVLDAGELTTTQKNKKPRGRFKK